MIDIQNYRANEIKHSGQKDIIVATVGNLTEKAIKNIYRTSQKSHEKKIEEEPYFKWLPVEVFAIPAF